MDASYSRVSPQGAPPPYTFVRRVYRHDLRPIVIFVALLSAVWALLWGISAFKDISVDKDNAPHIWVFDIILGALYIATAVIELFGVVAAHLRRITLVRAYAFLSFGAVLMVVASAFIRVIVHFIYKSTLINECISLAEGQTVVRFGLWGTYSTHTLSEDDATNFCNNAWNHDSVSEIVWLILVIILGLFFTSIAFSYYHQLLDPSNTRTRVVESGPTAPEHYNRPYERDASGLTYNQPTDYATTGQYAPPPGAPPYDADATKPPGYSNDEMSKGFGYGSGSGKEDKEDWKKSDPFADFDARGDLGEEGHQ